VHAGKAAVTNQERFGVTDLKYLEIGLPEPGCEF